MNHVRRDVVLLYVWGRERTINDDMKEKKHESLRRSEKRERELETKGQ